MKGARGKQQMSHFIIFEKMEKQDFKTVLFGCFLPFCVRLAVFALPNTVIR